MAATPRHPGVATAVEVSPRRRGVRVAGMREQRAAAEVGEGLAVPGRAPVGGGAGDEPMGAAVAPAVLLPVAGNVARVGRVHRDPGLDLALLVERPGRVVTGSRTAWRERRVTGHLHR